MEVTGNTWGHTRVAQGKQEYGNWRFGDSDADTFKELNAQKKKKKKLRCS